MLSCQERADLPENSEPAHAGPMHWLWESLVLKALTCPSLAPVLTFAPGMG